VALIELKTSDRIATITFNRPDALNALNSETLKVFSSLVKEVIARKDVSVIILTGAGDRAFIAGADIKEMQPMSQVEANHFSDLGQSVLFELENASQITIAAVNGFALGGGCEVAMACDLIYASEKAKFGQPEVNLGVIPGFGGTQRLLRLVGPIIARELIYTGANIDATEAQRVGLVAQVFPQERFLERVTAIATTIASKGPEALAGAKVTLRKGMDTNLKNACSIEREHFAACFATENQKEGMNAFLEKRKPSWKR